MKKYFVKETEEEIEFGEEVQLSFKKELEDGQVTVEKTVMFSADTVNWLIEMEVVEEREVEDDLLDFGEDDGLEPPCVALESLYDKVGELEERLEKVEALEGLVKTIHGTLLNIQKTLKKEHQKK